MKRRLLTIVLLLLTMPIVARNDLRQEIRNIVRDKKATVGVAVQTSDGRCFTLHNSRCYPLMSVFKFHVAVAVLQRMERESISPNSLITLDASWLPYGTS